MMLICSVICLLNVVFLQSSEAALLEPRQSCVPTASVHGPCHDCVCTADGVYYCRQRDCQGIETANLTQIEKRSKLPEIKDGDICIPGKTYKMDCNTCRCGLNNALLCTKMACFNWQSMAEDSRRKNTKTRRFDLHGTVNRDDGSNYEAPQKQCTPGKFYKRSKCGNCFCTHENKILCSLDTNNCKVHLNQLKKIEHFRPPVTHEEFATLPALNHASEKCEPGRTYRVHCNPCLCLNNKNLMCNRLLCLNVEATRKVEAKEKNGQPCDTKGQVKEENCVRCYCNSTVLNCEPVPNCITDRERMKLSGGKLPSIEDFALDYTVDNCEPISVYNDNCNHCYCENDTTLRCTQKSCLTYNQVQLLEKQRVYLKTHGL